MNGFFALIFTLTLIVVGLAIYFLPTIIARNRSHRNTLGIFLLNLFFGWTLIGWVGALVWSVYRGRD